MFSPLFHLHTNIYQHSWKWLVINPYHYVDAYILCIYAGVDGLDLVLKSRQQSGDLDECDLSIEGLEAGSLILLTHLVASGRAF